jgi:hypothetical protein
MLASKFAKKKLLSGVETAFDVHRAASRTMELASFSPDYAMPLERGPIPAVTLHFN